MMSPAFVLAAAASASGPDPTLIRLQPDMLINETGFGNTSALADEQDADEARPPSSAFFAEWTAWRYPVHVTIDLKSDCQVDSVAVYNDTGEARLAVSTGRPFDWSPLEFTAKGYKAWNTLPVHRQGRWLRLTVFGPSKVTELFVHGRRLKPVPEAKPAPVRRRPLPTMDRLVGVNAFIDDPIDVIAGPGGLVREYHPWPWDVEAPDGLIRFQPSGAGGGSWFFDDYYRRLKAAGSLAAPVVWESPPSLFKTVKTEHKPIAEGADPEDPRSYLKHAQHFYQWAARYGSRKVPDSSLTLAPGQPRVSGLGLLKYLENWNEPDKDWEGREGRFNPFDLAALSSADYDGHQGALGPRVGIKAADPSMKLVLGGLAGINLPLLKAMRHWAEWKRGGSFPADVINLHHYCSTSSGQAFQPGGRGISPEDDRLEERLLEVTRWRDSALPNVELWLTEYGWDTDPASPLHAAAVGSLSAQDVQSAWLIRAVMAIAAARLDGSTMFMLRDVNKDGKTVFETCGLTGPKGDWTKKTSWTALTLLRRTLKSFSFAGKLATGDPRVRAYEFSQPGGRRAVAAWCTTSQDLRLSGVALPVKGRGATAVSLEARTMGKTTKKTISAKGISADLSETPTVFLID